MAQLRLDYEKFKALNTEVLVMVPNGPKTIERFIQSGEIPYSILVDKGVKTGELYFQAKHFFKLGVPSIFLVNQAGRIAYVYYTRTLISEPDNRKPLAVLARLQVI